MTLSLTISEHIPDVSHESPGVMLGHGVEVTAARLPQPHHRPLHGPGQLEEQRPGDDGDIIIIIIVIIIIT